MTRMRVFWSVYCILVGVALLVKILFRLDFSGWTVAFAILLLESGVFLVTGGFGLRRGRSAQGSGDYFFYSGEIELPASENAPALTTAFSNAEIWFTCGMPPVTRVTCLFSSTSRRAIPCAPPARRPSARSTRPRAAFPASATASLS